MAIADTNSIIRTFLVAQSTLTDVVSTRVYCPRLPENVTLPAIGYFTRGGDSHPYIPGLVTPSVQFDCWGDTPIAAREVYRALYDVLQGVQFQNVVVDSTTYQIQSAIEEVQGQDLQDVDIPDYYKVMTFFSIQIKAT